MSELKKKTDKKQVSRIKYESSYNIGKLQKQIYYNYLL